MSCQSDLKLSKQKTTHFDNHFHYVFQIVITRKELSLWRCSPLPHCRDHLILSEYHGYPQMYMQGPN